MSKVTAGHIKAGVIFGDHTTNEYIYLPAGEVGISDPLCVFESLAGRQDLPLEAAAALVEKLSLRPIKHPRLGPRSY